SPGVIRDRQLLRFGMSVAIGSPGPWAALLRSYPNGCGQARRQSGLQEAVPMMMRRYVNAAPGSPAVIWWRIDASAAVALRMLIRSSPMTIKTIYIPAGGGFDSVSIETSQPVDPGPGEITVRLRASSLNFHDYMVVKGITGPKERRIPM